MKRVVIALTLCALAALPGYQALAQTHSSIPRLELSCSTPTANLVVACQLQGQNMAPHEPVLLYFRTWTGPIQGIYTVNQRIRTIHTDRRGFFSRPKFHLQLDQRYPAYRVTVDVTGNRGEEATITATGSVIATSHGSSRS